MLEQVEKIVVRSAEQIVHVMLFLIVQHTEERLLPEFDERAGLCRGPIAERNVCSVKQHAFPMLVLKRSEFKRSVPADRIILHGCISIPDQPISQFLGRDAAAVGGTVPAEALFLEKLKHLIN